jgi:hypothetical protein
MDATGKKSELETKEDDMGQLTLSLDDQTTIIIGDYRSRS